MLEYIGKYASCLVMTDEIEQEAVTQIYRFLNCPAFDGAKIRVMPDVHAGAGAVIGFTSSLTSKVIPNVIGVDIGCGVLAHNLGKVDIEFGELDRFIRSSIPSGFSVHEKLDRKVDETADEYRKVALETEQDEGRVVRSLGSLGGGNHFIEVDRDESGDSWLVIHSGSRNFGLKVALFHQAKAVKTVGKGHGLEWLEGEDAESYLAHMRVCQRYASENRMLMANSIFGFLSEACGWRKSLMKVESIHNYINFKDQTVRKGAISAHEGETVVIPWNMRDGLIIGEGKGNPEWNFSAPHGAGRVMGRGAAKRTLDMDEFRESMVGIWTSCVTSDTLDEAPMVYKDHLRIQAEIGDTVNVSHVLKPLYNFKAGREDS